MPPGASNSSIRGLPRLTGFSPTETLGATPRLLKSGMTSAEQYRQLWDTITAGRVWQGEFLNRKKNSELYWAAAAVFPILNDRQEITHFRHHPGGHQRAEEAAGKRVSPAHPAGGATEALHTFLQTGSLPAVAQILLQYCTDLLQTSLGFLAEAGENPRMLAVAGPPLKPPTGRNLRDVCWP